MEFKILKQAKNIGRIKKPSHSIQYHLKCNWPENIEDGDCRIRQV
ncbi:MAG: hypothetical protein PWP27_2339 [Clostridiales bacterium]|nr:hypothetical protein [Clostridiales bacterium]